MGLRDKIQTKLAKAFDGKLADAVNAFTGSYVIQSGWDPVTETGGETTVTYTGRGVLADYNTERIDGINILAGDIELVALVNEVTDKPAVDHFVTAPDLVTGQQQRYTAKRVEVDPAGVAYSVQLRRS
ncbi:TPA: glutamate 5-kinase [Serratia fonticola]